MKESMVSPAIAKALDKTEQAVQALSVTKLVSEVAIDSGESLITLIQSKLGTGQVHGIMLFTCTGTLPSDMQTTVDGITVSGYGEGLVEANGYYQTLYYRDTSGNIFTAHKNYSANAWGTWHALALKTDFKYRHAISQASVVNKTHISEAIEACYSAGYRGAVAIEFYRTDQGIATGTLYYNMTSNKYGAGILTSYYNDTLYSVIVNNGTVNFDRLVPSLPVNGAFSTSNENGYTLPGVTSVYLSRTISGTALSGWFTLLVDGDMGSHLNQTLMNANYIIRRSYEGSTWSAWTVKAL